MSRNGSPSGSRSSGRISAQSPTGCSARSARPATRGARHARPGRTAGLRAARHVRRPFEEIAPIVERSPEAARQLASRARRRVRGAAPVPDADLAGQWEVVEAFLAAARERLRRARRRARPRCRPASDGGRTGLSRVARGAERVAGQCWRSHGCTRGRSWKSTVRSSTAPRARLAPRRRTLLRRGLHGENGKIAELDFLLDPDRIARLDLTGLGGLSRENSARHAGHRVPGTPIAAGCSRIPPRGITPRRADGPWPERGRLHEARGTIDGARL
jgi:hypothetical protein